MELTCKGTYRGTCEELAAELAKEHGWELAMELAEELTEEHAKEIAMELAEEFTKELVGSCQGTY